MNAELIGDREGMIVEYRFGDKKPAHAQVVVVQDVAYRYNWVWNILVPFSNLASSEEYRFPHASDWWAPISSAKVKVEG